MCSGVSPPLKAVAPLMQHGLSTLPTGGTAVGGEDSSGHTWAKQGEVRSRVTASSSDHQGLLTIKTTK